MQTNNKSKFSTIIEGECPYCEHSQEFTRNQRSGEQIVCPKCDSKFAIDQVQVGTTFDGHVHNKFDNQESTRVSTTENNTKSASKLSFGWKFWLFLFIAVITSNLLDVFVITLLGRTYNYSNPSILFMASVAALFELVMSADYSQKKKIWSLILGFIGIKIVFYIISFLVVLFMY